MYYSSHGVWSTFGEIKKIELERGNDFTDETYPDDTPCIWATKTKRKALRYSVFASEWDRIDDENQPLTKEERKIMKDEIWSVTGKGKVKEIWSDQDGGFLICRISPRWTQDKWRKE
jgi:hypothetical protein